jgi:hypothetical protein
MQVDRWLANKRLVARLASLFHCLQIADKPEAGWNGKECISLAFEVAKQQCHQPAISSSNLLDCQDAC